MKRLWTWSLKNSWNIYSLLILLFYEKKRIEKSLYVCDILNYIQLKIKCIVLI